VQLKPFSIFLSALTKRDTDKLAVLTTEDHIFIDSLGNTMPGRATMRTAWRTYYSFCPGNIVAVFGAAPSRQMANLHRRTNGGHRLLGWLS
jgi:hypothetical protein